MKPNGLDDKKKNYKGQPDTWAYHFEIHITEYKFKHNIYIIHTNAIKFEWNLNPS